MIDREIMDMWVRRLYQEHSRSTGPSPKFWRVFISVFKGLAEGLSTSDCELKISTEHQGDYCLATFQGHQLHVCIDRRTSKLKYALVSPVLKILGYKSDVTEQGVLNIDPNSHEHRLFNEDGSQFGYTGQTQRDWPMSEQLAEYLLQKLVVPDFVDDRLSRS